MEYDGYGKKAWKWESKYCPRTLVVYEPNAYRPLFDLFAYSRSHTTHL